MTLAPVGNGCQARRYSRRAKGTACIDSTMVRQPSLSLGILALLLWAVSWSWLVGVGVTVVRVGEVGALVAGIAAVAVGAATQEGHEAQGSGLESSHWCSSSV
jgi:hypothetical protein